MHPEPDFEPAPPLLRIASAAIALLATIVTAMFIDMLSADGDGLLQPAQEVNQQRMTPLESD